MNFRKILSLLSALAVSVSALAAEIVITGKVSDKANGEALPGAIVVVNGTSFYASTDVDGSFELRLPESTKLPVVLQVSMMSYVTENFSATEKKPIKISLTPDAQILGESQVIAYGKQSKMSVTGAISSIGTQELLVSPSGSTGAALAGAVTGISSVQVSGQPGAEDPVLFVRGAGSLTEEASQPLILVDGVERSFYQMDANEIETITVLKDAASTAVFGVRGANGVILVTTRRGKEGKMHLSYDGSFGITQPLRHLTGADSYTYSKLYSEAQLNDGIDQNKLLFTPYITERFRTGDSPLVFPSVNWEDYIFKDFAWQTHHNVNMSGGNKYLRYFVSLGYLHEDGMMKQYYEDYNSNFTYDRFNYRANIDADITKTTHLVVNIGGRVGVTNEPKNYDIWRNIMWCVPFASYGFDDQQRYINSAGNAYIPLASKQSGIDLYYNYGYTRQTANTLNLDMEFVQDFDFVTPGLNLKLKGGYNTDYSFTTDRTPVGCDSWFTPYLSTDGVSMVTNLQDVEDIPTSELSVVYKTDASTGLHERMTYGDYTSRSRNWYLEAGLNYARTFGNHSVTGLLLYNQSKFYYPAQYNDIPTAYVGYVARVTYGYKDRYFVDLNAGLNGSENFAPDKRYGFFPSGSVGWVMSEESWMKKQKVINFLKLRVSYGLVGNDKYSGSRFLYLNGSWNGNRNPFVGNSGYGAYQFGSGGTMDMMNDAVENAVGNSDVTWEKCAKQNYGFDMKFFDYRLSLTADFFYEHRWDILTTRNTLPSITDIKLPMVNLGVVDNMGSEFSIGWADKIAGQAKYNVTFNFSHAKNKILEMDEVVPNEPYMAQTGQSTGRTYGFIFDRFLQPSDFDEDGKLLVDPETGKQILPELSGLGKPAPGDCLYKDLNNDGKINEDDRCYFGNCWRPEYTLGLIAGFNWKGIGFTMQWTAALKADRMLTGEYRTAFGTDNSRALLKYLADGRCYYDDEGAFHDGRFPRLTLTTSKTWNEQNSSVWMVDGSYLRLKTMELSYTFSEGKVLRALSMSTFKIYFSGYNLLTLAPLTEFDIDPEGMTGDGSDKTAYTYPNNRIFNFGINMTF